MKVLITGGSGYLAWELIRQMKKNQLFDIVAASSVPAKLVNDSNYDGIQLIDNEDIWNSIDLMKSFDVIIHTAFCRKSVGEQLMSSLKFSQRLFEAAISCDVSAIINLSSQSIYGSGEKSLPNEDGEYAPGYLYALAKSASELLLESIASKKNTRTKYVNIRLASLVGPGKSIPDNVLYKFVENALEGKDISIQGGKQKFSFINVKDAAYAIICLMNIPFAQLEKVYNLGPEKQTNIIELAGIASGYAVSRGRDAVRIHIKEDNIVLNAGMNSERLYKAINWRPQFSIEDTVAATGEYIESHKYGGGYSIH